MGGDFADILLRLLIATLVGGIIGLNRDLHGKETGVRTLGLVSLGAALIGVACTHASLVIGNADAISRIAQGVIQGVLTGIGFLGAGVIVRDTDSSRVRNLTTAATVWTTAVLGIACGLGPLRIVGAGAVLTLLLLTVGGPIERVMDRRFAHPRAKRASTSEEESPPDRDHPIIS